MNRTFWLVLPWLLLPLAVAASFGCKPKSSVRSSSDILDTVTPTRSNLDQAYDMLARIEEFRISRVVNAPPGTPVPPD